MMRAGWLAALWILTSGFTLGGTVGTRALTVTFNAPLTSTLTVASSAGSGTPTYSRNSVGTFLNAKGLLEVAPANIPRFEYNSSGTALGLLVEGTSKNWLLQSSTGFAWSASWSFAGSFTATVTGTIAAPDGSNDATTITIPAGAPSYTRAMYQTTAETATGNHTGSVWVKCASGTQTFQLDVYDNGVADHTSGDLTATTTWQRLSFTYNTTSTAQKGLAIWNGTDAAAKTIYIWGMQLEALAFASSYIPTTTAAVTRAADFLAYPATGNVPATGPISLVVSADMTVAPGGVSAAQTIISNGTASANREEILVSTVYRARGYVRVGDVVQADMAGAAGTAFVTGVAQRVVLACAENDFGLYINGSLVNSDTSGSLNASRTGLRIGVSYAGVNEFFAGHICRVLIFNNRVTTAEVANYRDLNTP
jgi:hypothetical protein